MAISLNINGKSHNVNSDPDLATAPSNPFCVHEAKAAKLEPRDAVQDPRCKVRGPRTCALGPWPSDRGPGFRQGCR